MKNKSWIIILIMGIALTISIGYSIDISRKARNAESTVTTTSIIEMTATTATIKNTLKGTGTIEYKEPIKEDVTNETAETESQIENSEIENGDVQSPEETAVDENSEENKTYQVTLSIEDKDLKKAKVGQDVEITIKSQEESLSYLGIVKKINEDINNKSTLNVEISNPDEKIKEGMNATCTVIIEKAENVVALPVEAVQKNDLNESYVDVVQIDGSAQSVIIKTGLSDDYYVEITSGLNVGDRVQIVKSSTTVVDNNSNNNNSSNNNTIN